MCHLSPGPKIFTLDDANFAIMLQRVKGRIKVMPALISAALVRRVHVVARAKYMFGDERKLKYTTNRYSHGRKLLVDPKEGVFSELLRGRDLNRHGEDLALHLGEGNQRLCGRDDREIRKDSAQRGGGTNNE